MFGRTSYLVSYVEPLRERDTHIPILLQLMAYKHKVLPSSQGHQISIKTFAYYLLAFAQHRDFHSLPNPPSLKIVIFSLYSLIYIVVLFLYLL